MAKITRIRKSDGPLITIKKNNVKKFDSKVINKLKEENVKS